MSNNFDLWGWYTEDPRFADRVASKAPANKPGAPVAGQPYPNWTGHEWVMQAYVEPPPPAAPVEPPAPPAPEWAWYLDIGPFTDRLGAAATAIDVSSAAPMVAIRSDFARRKWIDLKDPRVIAAVHYLAGQPHPVLGTLDPALLTATQADMVLNAPVLPAENLALRKVYFNA